MSDLMERKQQLLAALHARLEATFDAAALNGVAADVYADTERLAAAMVAVLPTANVHDQLAGPFYDTAGIVELLGISKQAVAKRVAAGTLIGCQLADGRTWVYPTWQFAADDFRPIAYLYEVWKTLRDAADPWTAVFWLRARNERLGTTAVDYLQNYQDPNPVLAEARADAARWAA